MDEMQQRQIGLVALKSITGDSTLMLSSWWQSTKPGACCERLVTSDPRYRRRPESTQNQTFRGASTVKGLSKMKNAIYEDASYENRLMRLPEVMRMVGYSRASLYRLMDSGQFPTPVHLGARAVGWLSRDVRSWILERAKESGKLVAA